MKIKCYIPSYSCPEYFYKTIETISQYDHQIDFLLYVTDSINKDLLPKNISYQVLEYSKEIGHGLVHQYYDDIKNSVDNYDCFIYTEDDIEITPKTFETFIKYNRELEDDKVIGFMRYEIYEGRYYMNEFQPGTPHSVLPIFYKINGKEYVSYQNVHQGCFILEKRNLKKLLSNPNFIRGWPNNTVMLEDAASNVFKGTWPGTPDGLLKIYPANDIDSLLVHHLSDRHTKISRNFLQLHEVKERIQLCLTHLQHQ